VNRNLKVSLLTDRCDYILLDGLTNFINLLIYSPNLIGFPLYFLWFFLLINYLLCYLPSKLNSLKQYKLFNDNSRKKVEMLYMFYYCSQECPLNSSKLNEYRKEALKIMLDIIGHIAGFFLGINYIQSTSYKVATIVFMFILYQRMVKHKNILMH